MSTSKIWWNDFCATDFQNIDAQKTIAILPIAAIEQHGPHLPVGTDAILNQGCLDMLVASRPQGMDLRILPVQAPGKSNEHLWAKGTVTLPATTLIEAWMEIGLSVARTGIRKLVFVNSHGGNEEIMGIVARELRVRADMFVVKTSWSRFGTPDGLISDVEKRHGIHGGDVETSLMLHFRPELVIRDKLQSFVSITARDEAEYQYLRPTGTHAYSWIASDLNPFGAVGDASIATAEKGRAIAEHEVAGFAALLKEVERFPLIKVG
ncbi:MAG: creatininase protein [Hyphomicrobiales bacterium]|nr:creatininase protein [Hyphomicrobiales bacterium]